jgi:hypothetical protein
MNSNIIKLSVGDNKRFQQESMLCELRWSVLDINQDKMWLIATSCPYL